MRDERLEVSVTFDPAKGYVATAPELRSPVTALSLGGLRRRIEALMLPDSVNVRLMLDKRARQERDQRREAGRAVRPTTPGYADEIAVLRVESLAVEIGVERAQHRAVSRHVAISLAWGYIFKLLFGNWIPLNGAGADYPGLASAPVHQQSARRTGGRVSRYLEARRILLCNGTER
jgi:hypothetical protein